MKQMTLIEMDGFLKGKCIPSDLKVNETNAEYLARKFCELESKIALLEVQLKLSEAAERAWESSMMKACGEDGPKSVADKFAELESKLETALRECRSAGITIDNLEAKCAALAADNEKAMEAMRQADAAVKLAHEKFSAMAAENARLKDGILQASEDMEAHHDDCALFSYDADGEQMDALLRLCDAQDSIASLGNVETPATDAFLAEVRAQGVDAAIEHLINKFQSTGHIGVPVMALEHFADQLRKGGNQ